MGKNARFARLEGRSPYRHSPRYCVDIYIPFRLKMETAAHFTSFKTKRNLSAPYAAALSDPHVDPDELGKPRPFPPDFKNQHANSIYFPNGS